MGASAISTSAAEHPLRAPLLLGVAFGCHRHQPDSRPPQAAAPDRQGVAEATVPGVLSVVLSVVLWATVPIVALQCVVLVMRADDHGEGGSMALLAIFVFGRRQGVVLAIGLAALPRMDVRQASDEAISQVYVPQGTWLLSAAVLGLVFGFDSSKKPANACGIAVPGNMLVITVPVAIMAVGVGRGRRLR